MSARSEDPALLRFSLYELDLVTDELRKQGRALKVPPKALRLLKLLAIRGGDLVTRDEIKASLWPSTNIDFDRNINLLINRIREILGDDAENPHYIETLPQKGYRFIYPVSTETRAGAANSGRGSHMAAETLVPLTSLEAGQATGWVTRKPGARGTQTGNETEPGREADLDRSRGVPNPGISRRLRALLMVAVVAGLALAAAWRLTGRRQRTPHVAPPARLAVLPVENLTGDPGREYVADGLTEEIISQLGSLNPGQLAVIARTSVMPYKHTEKTVAQIGHELQVDYVLECSLRQWGNTVRISAQLIAVRDQAHVWANTFQSSQHDVLKMQSEIADAVAAQTSFAFPAEQPTPASAAHPVDPQVYELVLRGRYEWRKRTNASLQKAVEYLEQAITLDQRYAPAYADLAGVYAVLPYYSDSSPAQTFPQAEAAAEKALQLDETLAEAHTILGLVECSSLNVDAGEREYQRALQLDPSDATAHQWRSFCLWMMNRRGEAVNELENARRLDPLSWIIYADEALTLSADHQNDRAISLLKTAIESEPEFAETHRALGVVYLQKGELPRAIEEAQRAVELDPNNQAQATLGYVYAAAGKTPEAKAILAELTNPSKRPSVRLVYLSYIYIGLGQKNKALTCLERADRENSLVNALTAADVIFDPIRSDPRFLNLTLRHQPGHDDIPGP